MTAADLQLAPREFQTLKSERTFQRVLDSASALFESKGFEQTTLRDISRQSGLGLGAIYYYFPSKEAIAIAFYERINREVQDDLRKRPKSSRSLPDALKILLRLKLERLEECRGLAAVILQQALNPASPLSPFSRASGKPRSASLALFQELVEDSGAAKGEEVERMARALWLAHLMILVFWLHDQSPARRETDRAIDTLCTTVSWSTRFSRLPGFSALRGRIYSHLDALVPKEG